MDTIKWDGDLDFEAIIEEEMKEVRRYMWEQGRKPTPTKPSVEALHSLRKLVPGHSATTTYAVFDEIEDAFWRDLEKEFGPIPPYKGDGPRHVPPAANVQQGPI